MYSAFTHPVPQILPVLVFHKGPYASMVVHAVRSRDDLFFIREEVRGYVMDKPKMEVEVDSIGKGFEQTRQPIVFRIRVSTRMDKARGQMLMQGLEEAGNWKMVLAGLEKLYQLVQVQGGWIRGGNQKDFSPKQKEWKREEWRREEWKGKRWKR